MRTVSRARGQLVQPLLISDSLASLSDVPASQFASRNPELVEFLAGSARRLGY